MCAVLSKPALAQTKILRALVRCLVWADPARPPKQHLAHLRYNSLHWSRSLRAGFLLCDYSPAPHA